MRSCRGAVRILVRVSEKACSPIENAATDQLPARGHRRPEVGVVRRGDGELPVGTDDQVRPRNHIEDGANVEVPGSIGVSALGAG
jgi:hypothetical protein